MNKTTNIQDLLKKLIESDVDFVIIGGFAGVLHGSSLVTRDLDLCVDLNTLTIQKLRTIFKDASPVHRMTPKKLSFLEYPEDISSLKNIYIDTNFGVIDFLSEVIGVGGFDVVAKNAVKIKLFDFSCKVISIEDLIQTKKTLGRPKDLMSVEELSLIKTQKKLT